MEKIILFVLLAGCIGVHVWMMFKGHSHGSAKDGKPDGKTKYSCPMHPEISQDTPGQCTECGMNLVKVTK
ncbi:MAG TPA: heavy metal-binding domain-containing protein [Candidatus Paceibacterota bacterium]